MRAYERLLNYIKFSTPSDGDCDKTPSSDCQFELAIFLVEELKSLGLNDAYCDENCYVYAHLPATEGLEHIDKIGFISHLDTVSDFCDKPVVPIITKDYNGNDLTLPSGLELKSSMFPHLTSLKGRTLLTGDGTTILGADDKAGIAEIMSAIEIIKDIPHGGISIAFTPDEELGRGTDLFNLKAFDAKYAYTLDGETEGEIQYETFNAAKAEVEFYGTNVHPGQAKNVMINAIELAMEFNNLLPYCDKPEFTEDREGFFHITDLAGNVSYAKSKYIIRDHDTNIFSHRKSTFLQIANLLNEKYKSKVIHVAIDDQYRNMREVIDNNPIVKKVAEIATKSADLEPLIIPIRGGTDGSGLSFMGLPTPNLGTGGHAYHGPYEHITFEAMDKCVNVIVEIVKEFAKND